MLNAVIFDIDNTLYAYDPCDQAGVRAMQNAFSDMYPEISEQFPQMLAQAKREVKKHTAGMGACHNRMLYSQRIIEAAGGLSAENALHLYHTYWDAYLAQMQLFDGAETLLRELHGKGIRIGFCTDLTAMIQLRKLCRLGLSDIADAMVSSEESGAEKPDPASFVLLLKKLGTTPDCAVMIGDDEQKDIAGAANAGIRALRLGSEEAPDFHRLSRRLKEMLS